MKYQCWKCKTIHNDSYKARECCGSYIEELHDYMDHEEY